MIKAQEGKFKGSLTRFGHGLQRSFLLAILQELASIEASSEEDNKSQNRTLIFGCEEPELYQHPPQARHLSNGPPVAHRYRKSDHPYDAQPLFRFR
jgi:hypothetical protein